MQVLALLATHRGRVVTKERILQNVWADTFVGDEVLSRAISELRRVLGDNAKSPKFIQTIPKGGYRLIAPVVIDELEWGEVERIELWTTRSRGPSWWFPPVAAALAFALAAAYTAWSLAHSEPLRQRAPSGR
jgi:DNA-binding winged helix-turn-helix (wHTH) protein